MVNQSDTKTALLGFVILAAIIIGVFWLVSSLSKKDNTDNTQAVDRSALANISVENTLISSGEEHTYTFQITDASETETVGKFCVHLKLEDGQSIDTGCLELQEMANVSTSNDEVKRLFNVRSKYAPNTQITQYSYTLSVDGKPVDSDGSTPIGDNIKAVN